MQLPDSTNDWIPPVSVTTHSGHPLNPKLRFFTPPPQELGQIASAGSTLKPYHFLVPKQVRVSLTVLCTLAIGTLGWTVQSLDVLVVKIVGIGISFPLGWYLWHVFKLPFSCEYLGDHGIARFTICGSEPLQSEVAVFSKTAELRHGGARHTIWGLHAQTAYSYRWFDKNQNELISIVGYFCEMNEKPKPTSSFHFATRAEEAWNKFLMPRLKRQLKQRGYIEFKVDATDWVRVGRGFLELFFEGSRQRLELSEISFIKVEDGSVTIHSKEAKFFGRKGKFSFDYRMMGNASRFFVAVEKVLGHNLC